MLTGLQAHPNDTTLYVLVGSSMSCLVPHSCVLHQTIDVPYWGGDTTIPEPRPVYQINNTYPGTDAAAGASAAFAACSNLYANRLFNTSTYSSATLQNSSYAQTLLSHAQSLYSFAVNATGGLKTYQTSVPAVNGSYPSSSYGDELAISALFLSRATEDDDLYNQAESYYSYYNLSEQNRVFNWDSKGPGLPVLFAQVAQSSANITGNFSKWQGISEHYFDSIINGDSTGYMTRGLYIDSASF
jgi:endoglucanase